MFLAAASSAAILALKKEFLQTQEESQFKKRFPDQSPQKEAALEVCKEAIQVMAAHEVATHGEGTAKEKDTWTFVQENTLT